MKKVISKQACPSGLRGLTQDLIWQHAWVRIPLLASFFALFKRTQEWLHLLFDEFFGERLKEYKAITKQACPSGRRGLTKDQIFKHVGSNPTACIIFPLFNLAQGWLHIVSDEFFGERLEKIKAITKQACPSGRRGLAQDQIFNTRGFESHRLHYFFNVSIYFLMKNLLFKEQSSHQASVPEWSKGSDSRSDMATCVGSNPTACIDFLLFLSLSFRPGCFKDQSCYF